MERKFICREISRGDATISTKGFKRLPQDKLKLGMKVRYERKRGRTWKVRYGGYIVILHKEYVVLANSLNGRSANYKTWSVPRNSSVRFYVGRA